MKTADIKNDIVAKLQTALPAWHFEAYGMAGAVACFPPGGPSSVRFGELSDLAPISSVCGPIYVVTHLRSDYVAH